MKYFKILLCIILVISLALFQTHYQKQVLANQNASVELTFVGGLGPSENNGATINIEASIGEQITLDFILDVSSSAMNLSLTDSLTGMSIFLPDDTYNNGILQYETWIESSELIYTSGKTINDYEFSSIIEDVLIDSVETIKLGSIVFTAAVEGTVNLTASGENGLNILVGTKETGILNKCSLPTIIINVIDFNKSTVTYDPGEGSLELGVIGIERVENGDKPINVPGVDEVIAPYGYELVGWTLIGDPIVPSDYVVIEDVVFVAEYGVADFSVTYLYSKGTLENGVSNPTTVPYMTEIVLPELRTEDSNLTFIGWFSEPGFITQVTSPYVVTSDMLLYGAWDSMVADTIEGFVNPEGRSDNDMVGGVITLYNDEYTYTATTTSNGYFAFHNIVNGIYNLSINYQGFLNRTIESIMVNGEEILQISTFSEAISILAGDIDGATGIDTGDLAFLISKLGLVESDPGYDGIVDFDRATGIDTSDLALVIKNLGLTTDNYPTWTW